jgi:putative hemolysin
MVPGLLIISIALPEPLWRIEARLPMSLLPEIIVICVMLILNAVFVAFEMALASVSKARLVVLAGRKVKGADAALFMKENIEASFAIAQLGITVSTAIAAATGGFSASDSLAPWLAVRCHLSALLAHILSLILWVIPLSCFTIVFSELFPKIIALNNRDRVCLQLSPTMKALYYALHPVVRILEHIVKSMMKQFIKQMDQPVMSDQGLHELHVAVALARTSSIIGAQQEKIVLAAAELSTRPVRDIIIPIDDISTIPLKATLGEALIRAHMDMHTRFPVCALEGNNQTIQGYVNFKDIIAALRLNPSDPSVRGILRPIKQVAADEAISRVLEVMIQGNHHIALVADKDGLYIGIVTLEDIIEELVGDIEDEFDRMPTYAHPYGAGWIVGGGITMEALRRTLGLTAVPADKTERLCDWCDRFAPKTVQGGEVIEAEGLRVMLRKFRRHKVSEAAVMAQGQ